MIVICVTCPIESKHIYLEIWCGCCLVSLFNANNKAQSIFYRMFTLIFTEIEQPDRNIGMMTIKWRHHDINAEQGLGFYVSKEEKQKFQENAFVLIKPKIQNSSIEEALKLQWKINQITIGNGEAFTESLPSLTADLWPYPLPYPTLPQHPRHLPFIW